MAALSLFAPVLVAGNQDPKAGDAVPPASPTPPSAAGGTGMPGGKSPGKATDEDQASVARDRVEAARRREVASLETMFFLRFKQVEALYPILAKGGWARPSGPMRVPLSARLDREFGSRDREIVHEDADVTWEEGLIATLLFSERRSVQGGGPLVRRRWYVRPSFSDAARSIPAGVALHLILDEVLPSGSRNLLHFSFDTGEFLRSAKAQSEVPAAEQTPDLRSFAVDSQERRVAFLREAIRLLELLERRLVWVIKSQRLRDQQELDRVFRGRE